MLSVYVLLCMLLLPPLPPRSFQTIPKETQPTVPNMTFSKILLACAGVALAAEMPEHCKTLKPLPEKAEICEPTAQVLGDLDPSSHCVVYSVMENKKSCNEFCTEQGAKCAKAVDDLRVRKPCQYNFNSPVDCETSNYYDVHCICEVEVEEPPKNDCEYLLPLTGKNEKECTKGYFTQELKDGGKNCVALARLYKRSTCDEWCEGKGATCVDAVDNTDIGSGCEGFYDKAEEVNCQSTGFMDLHCVCTETTTTTTPGCDSLLPFANPGEKLCTEGSLVEALEDGGQNCVAYAVLGKKSSCNDFCEARNSVCVDAIDNKVIGESCEYDTEEAVACNMKHFFDMHCVCRKPFQEGCGTVQLCDEVCNITYIGDNHKARCLQHCASDAEKFLDFTKGWCGAGEFCQVDEEVALLQRKVGKSQHDPVPCRTADEYCSGLCSSLGYLAGCEHKCMSVAHSLK
ncbi:unnamed protein product, partial [Symbiodinium sp. KB8]